ncbi:glycosyltransferase [Argonema antarcticum]|uniref:glycosyltransferase n=1 Tax=Argonema antarcticum TaxID=2942763 RepID=UPI00201335C6|nr:glycosyltransferase [Argonema antarcticum]MCL1472498.1 glycosyltransferase [Argonema antarcticum A004/B2]
MSQPLIITGMHRSGTSLTASFIKAIGVNLGNNFLNADDRNLKGYFEEIDFLEFQRSVLQNSCPPDEAGWHDWGWTESEKLDCSKFENYIENARNLINRRQQNFSIWGWKDPRTTLMLEFWNKVLPEAKYLLVYRFPWDVADSISRLNERVFDEHPDYALRIWAYYNNHLLDFYKKHSERCILFNINAWLEEPEKLIELIKNKLKINFVNTYKESEFKEVYEQQMFTTLAWDAFVVKKLYSGSNQYSSLLAELDEVADIPSGFSVKAIAELSHSRLTVKSAFANFLDRGTISESLKSTSLEQNETIVKEMSVVNEYENEIAVSVVIPCFNQGEFILEAISSVQSCQDRIYEILIINDCSTEKLTLKVLNYLKENGYHIIEHQSNQGLAEARNTGVKKARGRYILPLDSDNKIRAKYLTKAIEILDKYPEIGVVYGDAEFFGEKTGIWEVPEFNINKLAARNYIDACAVYRKEVWSDCGGYDSKIPGKMGYEDWDFWLGSVEKGWKFYHVREVLFDYRVRSDSMVSLCRIPENHARLVNYICAKHLEIYKTNFASILAEKDSALLKEQIRYEGMEMELQKTQAAFEESQSELERIQSAWSESQEQVQRIQSAWEQAQSEVQRIESAWKEAQKEVQIAYAASERSQSELRRIQTAWEEAQSEVEHIRSAWSESQEQLRLTHSEWDFAQLEVEEIRNAWEKSQEQLKRTQAELEQSQERSQKEAKRIQTAWEEAQSEAKRIQTAWEEAEQQVQLTQAEWERAEQQLQLTQAEWETTQSEAQRIQTAWNQAEQQLELTQAEWETTQSEAKRIQTAWNQAEQQLELTQVEWETTQSEAKRIQTAWNQAQEKVQLTQVEWERSQSELQLTRTEWQKVQQQTQYIQGAWEQTQQQAQHIQTVWEQTQSEVQHIQGAWEQTQQQTQHIQTAWEQTQQQTQHIQTAWEQTQQQTQHIQTAWEQTQQQVDLIQTAWEQAQQQAQQSQSQLQQMQVEWERSQSQLQQMQAEWERSQSQLQQMQAEWERSQNQLQIVQAEHQQTQAIINQMESSKFWKLRKAWVRFKQAIGFSNNIEKQ